MAVESHYLSCPVWDWNGGGACTCKQITEISDDYAAQQHEARVEKIARALAASDYPDTPEPSAADYRRAEAVLKALEED